MMDYSVNGTSNVVIDAEEASDLVALVLQDDYESLSQEIQRLTAGRTMSTISAVDLEDLTNNIRFRDAMDVLLQYYLTHDDYVEFKELMRTYGYV
jgi:hypothetical protein